MSAAIEGTPTGTWRRFTLAVAILAGVALTIGLALSYASVYRVAYHAGFDAVWIDAGTWQLRPAHLFPLTLDVPVLVGYAGTIALAGRRSVAWARFVLTTCAVATVAAQVVDGAGLVTEHAWVRALVHGWPPALAVLTTHLLVLILQALGFLVPPAAAAARPSWVARAWAWVRRAVADIRATPDLPTPTQVGAPPIPEAPAPLFPEPPQAPTPRRALPSTAADDDLSRRRAQKDLTDLVGDVRAKRITQAEAARQGGVSTKTIQRHVERAISREAAEG